MYDDDGWIQRHPWIFFLGTILILSLLGGGFTWIGSL